MNIIETLTAGFNTATRKVWLIALPVLLDVALWLGPKVSIAPVIDRLIATFRAAAEASAGLGGTELGVMPVVDGLMQELQSSVGRTNLLSLLAWGRLGLPGVAGLRPIEPGVDRVIQISSYGTMLLSQVVIMAVGLLLACVFLGLLGQQVRSNKASLGQALRRTPTYWLYLVVLLVPLGMALMTGLFLGVFLGPFAPFLWLGIMFVLLFLSFIPQAITMDEERPLGALVASLSVVRLNFWATLGLILLSSVIETGLALLWRRLLDSTGGTVVAILINAYVGTGLALAAFIFYRDRLAQWRKVLEQQRSVNPDGGA